MKKTAVLIVLASVFIMSGFDIIGQDEKDVYMTSLEWPPYSGEVLSRDGCSINIASRAFAASGYELKVKFYPWKRTVRTAERDLNFIGYLPEYYFKEIERKFIFSDPIGESPLGFISLRSNSFSWEKLSDLKGKVIGVVEGYVNTDDFDKMVAEGKLTVEKSVDDLTSLRKLLRGRIELAVIDRNVFEYMMNVYPEFYTKRGTIEFNEKLLGTRKLYACFRRSPKGAEACRVFNAGLKQIDSVKMQNDYISNSLGR